MTTSEVTFRTAQVPINNYLDGDTFYYIFKTAVRERPHHLFTFSCVCKSWNEITKKDALWEDIASKLGIVDEKNGFLKEKITQLFLKARQDTQLLEKETLLAGETREWVFVAMQRRLQNFLRANVHDTLRKTYNEKQQTRKERIERLSAAFKGYMCLFFLGYDTLKKAGSVAEILASDKYMTKEPLKQYQELCLTLKHEERFPLGP